MTAYFVDTSGIVKRYIQETGTAWVQGIADPAAGNSIYLARITAVEVVAAVIRRQRGGSLAAPDAVAVLSQFRQDIALEYHILEITPGVLTNAMSLVETHGLRAYDAVQLAVAIELTTQRRTGGLPPVTLVSADQELNPAAAASGLSVEDPNRYP